MSIRLLASISLALIIIAGVTIQSALADAACTGAFCVDGGGNMNTASATYTTVSGGNTNDATNLGATIGGGHSNLGSGVYTTIAGGYEGEASGNYAAVGGGQYNSAKALNTTVGGGYGNSALAESATVSGGTGNSVSASYGTIAGGGLNSSAPGNRVTDSYGTVGGGGNNQAGNGNASLADRTYATVAGGFSNTASGIAANVAGGRSNTASAAYAMVPGGYASTASGDFSFAAGRQARALQSGSFVWGDNTAAFINSTVPNQFIARASGGVRFYSNAAATTGVSLPAGSGAWSNLSDRNMKDNFAAVDSSSILERVASMPIQQWNYKSQDESVKHIGPTAQDFAAAFGVGENDTTISTIDADGVALAAIQGLYQENQQLKRDLAALKAQVNAIAHHSVSRRHH
jgi:hypothetical protein